MPARTRRVTLLTTAGITLALTGLVPPAAQASTWIPKGCSVTTWAVRNGRIMSYNYMSQPWNGNWTTTHGSETLGFTPAVASLGYSRATDLSETQFLFVVGTDGGLRRVRLYDSFASSAGADMSRAVIASGWGDVRAMTVTRPDTESGAVRRIYTVNKAGQLASWKVYPKSGRPAYRRVLASNLTDIKKLEFVGSQVIGGYTYDNLVAVTTAGRLVHFRVRSTGIWVRRSPLKGLGWGKYTSIAAERCVQTSDYLTPRKDGLVMAHNAGTGKAEVWYDGAIMDQSGTNMYYKKVVATTWWSRSYGG